VSRPLGTPAVIRLATGVAVRPGYGSSRPNPGDRVGRTHRKTCRHVWHSSIETRLGGETTGARWCSVTAIPRGGAMIADAKHALQAHHLAAAVQPARKINECRRERPQAPGSPPRVVCAVGWQVRVFRVAERDRRALNTSASRLRLTSRSEDARPDSSRDLPPRLALETYEPYRSRDSR
jgi:hypothetical protein